MVKTRIYLNTSRLNPYLSVEGLAFKTPGDDDERRANLITAMDRLRVWCMGNGGKEEAIEAMNYLNETCHKVRVFLVIIQGSFAYDEAFEGDIIRKICAPAYNGMIRRLE